MADALLHLERNVDFTKVFVNGIAKRKQELVSSLINPETREASQEELLAFSYLENFLTTIKLTGESARQEQAQQ